MIEINDWTNGQLHSAPLVYGERYEIDRNADVSTSLSLSVEIHRSKSDLLVVKGHYRNPDQTKSWDKDFVIRPNEWVAIRKTVVNGETVIYARVREDEDGDRSLEYQSAIMWRRQNLMSGQPSSTPN